MSKHLIITTNSIKVHFLPIVYITYARRFICKIWSVQDGKKA